MPLALSRLVDGGLVLGGHPFDRPLARAGGLRDSDVSALVATGVLRQVLRGVYLDARVPDDLAVRAACLRLRLPPGAAVVRLSAAWLLGVDGRMPGQLAAPPVVECAVPPGRQPLRRPGVRCYVASLAGDLCEIGGIPSTTGERTGLDCLRWLRPHMALGVADALAASGHLRPDTLLTRAQGERRLRGLRQARYLAALIEPRTESMGESWLRLRIVDAGFPRPRVQIEVLDAAGRCVYRLDLGWEDERAAVEYDGEAHHSAPGQVTHDRRRRDDLEGRFGWRLLAVGKGEVLGPSMALERGVGELLSLEPRILRRAW